MVKTIRSLWSLPLAASLLVLGAAAALPVQAQPMPPAAMGMGGPGMGMGMHGRFGASPEHMGRMIDHMLDGLNASDAQRAQIKQIVAAAATDMKTAQGGAARTLHQRGMQIFTAPTVDAAAAEQLRQQMLQQHEQMSRRMMQAMLDVARVLTPEQRAKVGERMRDRQSRMEERHKRMERERPAR